MKRVSTVFICLLSVIAALFFGGCDNNQGSDDNGQGTEGTITVTGDGIITVTVKGEEKCYFSISTEEQVREASINKNTWDIGFQRPRTILTNSGITATTLNSDGAGMVWYTEKTDFDTVVLDDAVKTGDLSEYFTDTSKWFYSMGSDQNITYNVINYTGYGTGSGTATDTFKTALYDQKQFYKRGEASSYPVTNIVYIVQHGDGVHVSKIQVSQYEYASSSDTYVVKYKTLD
ncbi:MAG: HmuY family protein [Treponema sp.]|jgi:hypothetical protein|nr:HmuY family protein [Treponema sp.]